MSRQLAVVLFCLPFLVGPLGADAPGTGKGHWSLRKRSHPPIPPFAEAADRAWVRNPIDAFVLARLKQAGMRPAPEADRQTLIRRVSFDLTGLPPTPAGRRRR